MTAELTPIVHATFQRSPKCRRATGKNRCADCAPEAGSRESGVGSRESGVGSREPGAGSRQPAIGNRQRAGRRRPSVANR
ncbi:hypothetical protein DF053_04390 [Burkholderia cepacia]|nr:hypothetical protein DF053_04390 [Burkholderia cepacia]